ncbi:double-stranded RNA-binding protein Staufen homolog 2-like [Ornithodoros turicata]
MLAPNSNSSPGNGCPPPMTPAAVTSGAVDGEQPTATVANTKEKKTPMCLVNELARFNKVQHQYRLVDEAGPPHKKTFTVVLRLAAHEEYRASGSSIKRAQHAAAQRALDETSLPRPAPKGGGTGRAGSGGLGGALTPTVELNALAMKRGELTTYRVAEVPRLAYLPSLNFQGMYNQRYHYPKAPPPSYCATLEVGQRRFRGEGPTEQAARHAAATQALRALRDLPLPDQGRTTAAGGADGDDLKSPVSLVHELALKRNLPVSFEVIQEAGPPHMRTFVTCCRVGDLVAEGEGNGKKVSKKRAAEGMLEKLRELPGPPPASPVRPRRPAPTKKKARNLVREARTDGGPPPALNPISRLIQIQQAKKEREPTYTVLAERGDPRQREFVMQCLLGNLNTQGTGPNKKTAKRNAAEAMLQCLGYSKPVTRPVMEGGDQAPVWEETPKAPQTQGCETRVDPRGGRQLVPGLLLVPEKSAPRQEPLTTRTLQTTSAIAKELLDKGVSPTAESLRPPPPPTAAPAAAQSVAPVRPKQQLMYLADVLGFQVHFTDFPKGNKMEFLSLVTLTTNPPQVSHGAGPTLEASHDQAALAVLRTLAQLGLDAVAPQGLAQPDVPSAPLMLH